MTDFSDLHSIRLAIIEAGKGLYDSLPEGIIKDIASEFQGHNELYIWYMANEKGDYTKGCRDVLTTGFTEQQMKLLNQLIEKH